MKPGVSLARTARWPKRAASAASASATQGAVSRPSTTSTTFISGTGLKKWKPATRSGCLHAAAIAVIEKEEVLEASRESGATIASSAANSSRLAFRSSTTASITTGQAATPERVSAITRFAVARSHSAAVRRPFSLRRSSCADTAALASRAAPVRLSCSRTRMPACAATWAMPWPITPAPITARLKSERETSRGMGWRFYRGWSGIHAPPLTRLRVLGKLRAQVRLPGEEPHAIVGTHARVARSGIGSSGRGAGFPFAPDHTHLPLAGGRLHRHSFAAPRRDLRALLRADGADREQARSERHHRPGIRRPEREARRLHVVADAHGRVSRAAHAEAGLGSDPRSHLHHRRLGLHLRRGGEKRLAVQDLPGPPRLGQGEPGEDVVRLDRDRHLAAPPHGGGVDENRRDLSARTLQGQCGFDPGAARRPRHGAVGFERLGTLRRRGTVPAAGHF